MNIKWRDSKDRELERDGGKNRKMITGMGQKGDRKGKGMSPEVK